MLEDRQRCVAELHARIGPEGHRLRQLDGNQWPAEICSCTSHGFGGAGVPPIRV